MRNSTFCISLLALLLANHSLYSQSAVVPPGHSLSRSNSAPRMSGQSNLSGNGTTLNLGPIALQAGSYYRYITSANLLSSPGSLNETSVSEVGLIFNGEVGNKGTIYYSPRWSSYSNDAFGDRFSHTFGGNIGDDGTINVGGWDVGFSPSYSRQYQFLTETAQLTETEQLGLGVNARYQINSATSFGIGTSYNLLDAENFNGSDGQNYRAFLNRIISADMNASLIFTTGSNNTDANFDADYDQIGAVVSYQPSEYLYFSAFLAQQERSFNVVGAPDLDSTIYSLSANLTPLEFTTLSIRAGSSVGAALFSNQTRDNTFFSMYLNQRLFDFINLSLGYGESEFDLLDAAQSNETSRSDSYDYFDVRLGANVLPKLMLSLFYRDQENSSSNGSFVFGGDQYGMSASYSF